METRPSYKYTWKFITMETRPSYKYIWGLITMETRPSFKYRSCFKRIQTDISVNIQLKYFNIAGAISDLS